MAQQIQFSEEQEVVILTKMRKKLVEFFLEISAQLKRVWLENGSKEIHARGSRY